MPAAETSAIETLRNDIRVLRLLAGDLTQADLGALVGLTRQTIAAIEQGRYAPTLEVAFRIAYVFGRRVDEVFHWAPGASLAGKQVELAAPHATFAAR